MSSTTTNEHNNNNTMCTMVRVKDGMTCTTLAAPPPNLPVGVTTTTTTTVQSVSVSCDASNNSRATRPTANSAGTTTIHLVTGDGKMVVSKIKDDNVGDWKHPSEFMPFSMVKVESGSSHHVALTTNKQLVSWGKNDKGQLGRGDISTKKRKPKDFDGPKLIPSPLFQTMKIQNVACGTGHTLCLSEDGHVYSWGSNDCRQLGLGKSSPFCSTPHRLEALASVKIAQISAGGHHSFALTATGLVFRWGSNRYGQLGFENEYEHRSKPDDYDIVCHASSVEKARSVCCGENHTAFLTLEGTLLTCGLGASGRLGYRLSDESQCIPQEIAHLQNKRVSSIACGRDYTVAYVQSTNTLHYFGAQGNSVTTLPQQFDGPALRCGKNVFFIYQPHCVDDERPLEQTFQPDSLTLDQVLEMMTNSSQHSVDEINDKLSEALGKFSCVNGSFQLRNSEQATLKYKHGFDLKRADKFFEEVSKPCHSLIAEQALKTLMESLPRDPSRIISLRVFLLLPCCLRGRVLSEDVVVTLSTLILGMPKGPMLVLGKWLKTISTKYFRRYVWFFMGCAKSSLNNSKRILHPSKLNEMESAVESCVKVLDVLNELNKCRPSPIPYKEFNISNLVDLINIPGDFASRHQDTNNEKSDDKFRFCKYPFLFDSVSKQLLLSTQCQAIMARKPNETVLNVKRDRLVKDTRKGLSRKEKDLRKTLNIIFVDEIDYCGNGIRQEFFQLLIAEFLKTDFGAFYYEDESNNQWFQVKGENESSNLTDIRFVGLICGLALYNGVTLHLEFPSVLYKKLLDKPVEFEDLFDLLPVQSRSLENVMDYNFDDIEECMCLDYATPVQLCPNGANIPVNHGNKKDYVNKVTNHYLNTSVKKEFESFREGFYTAMPRKLLACFEPKELREVLVGNERYDFEALEKVTEYENDYHENHPTIRLFWEVFHGWEIQDQKDFLSFLTGTHRIPAYGISRLKFKIFRRSQLSIFEDPNEMFPIAYTCTNFLALPGYTNKESLDSKLLDAVKLSSGFGKF